MSARCRSRRSSERRQRTPIRTSSRSRIRITRTRPSAARCTASSRSCSQSSFQWAEAGHIPAYTPVTESPEYGDLQPQADYVDAAEILNYDPEAWFTGAGSDFHVYFAENIQGALLGGSDAEAAITGFEQRINKILAKPSPV